MAGAGGAAAVLFVLFMFLVAIVFVRTSFGRTWNLLYYVLALRQVCLPQGSPNSTYKVSRGNGKIVSR